MKIKISFILLMIAFAGISVYAQPGGGGGQRFQQRSVEERVADIHKKFDSTFKFDAAKQAKVDTIFANYYRNQDKMRQEMMSAGGERPDMNVFREKNQALSDARDKELKALLEKKEYNKWKDDLEPTTMRGRGGQGGGRGPGGQGGPGGGGGRPSGQN